ncbi:MAG TPA: spermidine/putrescine ABC transporter substrate-binding protein [Waddliaceae bacterium]
MKVLRMLLIFVLAAFSSCSSSKDKLYLFSWSEIFKPELIKEFEEKFDCKVVIAIYDSNESMYAKLKLGASGYDLIFPSSYYCDILAKQGMIQPLDPKKIPNISLLDPAYYKETYPIFGVPFLIGFSGLAYRQDRLQKIEPSWNVFAREDLKGRMTMLNDFRDALGAALKFLGYSINSKNPIEVDKAADQLIKWKKNLAKFESEQYKSGIASAEFLIVQGHTIDVAKLRREDPNILFVYPNEGAIMAIDYMAIPKEAKNPALASAFINFMLEPSIATQNITYINALIPVLPAYELLDQNLKQDPILFPPSHAAEKMEIIQDLKEETKLYFQAWDKVKAS